MRRLAKILKSNGVDGEVLVGQFESDFSELETTEPVFVDFDGLPVPFFVDTFEEKGSRVIVRLTGCHNLKDAEELVGKYIFSEGVDENTDSEEDFLGWQVFDGDRYVGTVDGVEDIPGNFCLCIGDTLIPLHEDLIESADPSARTIKMHLPEGLLTSCEKG